MRGAGAALLLALTLLLVPPSAASAQQFPLGTGTGTPILTLDQERLFENSAFGQRVAADLQAASRALAAENRRYEELLSAEERELTERRPGLPPEEFRELADAFDARVEGIRRAQEAKSRALGEYLEAERQRFFELALPVLAQLVRESGAVAVLDSRAIFIAADQIDITDTAIARIDADVGGGGGEETLPIEPLDEGQEPPSTPPEGGPPLELLDPAPLNGAP